MPGIKLVPTSDPNGSGFEILADQTAVDAQKTSGNRAGLIDDLANDGLALIEWKKGSKLIDVCEITAGVSGEWLSAPDQLNAKIGCAITTAEWAKRKKVKKAS